MLNGTLCLVAVFSYYASLGATNDIFSIVFNGYAGFIADFKLSERKSLFCSKNLLDQIFIAVDVSSATGEKPRKQDKRLDRQEFIQLVVRIAIAKCLLPAAGSSVGTPTVAEAVRAFFTAAIKPKADPMLFASPNDYRRTIYVEEIDIVLRRHEASLRRIYAYTAAMDLGSDVIANKLVSYSSYKEFMRMFKMVDLDLTERDAVLCYVCARMLVIDEANTKERCKLTHLRFEDFLEARSSNMRIHACHSCSLSRTPPMQ